MKSFTDQPIMKKIILLTLVLATVAGCKKDPTKTPPPIPYFQHIMGDYGGIRVNTHWVDTVVGYAHDSSAIVISLIDEGHDSVVSLAFNPPYASEQFSYAFSQGVLIPLSHYHPAVLSISNDSLYFRHQPGLGPYWTECFAFKLISPQ